MSEGTFNPWVSRVPLSHHRPDLPAHRQRPNAADTALRLLRHMQRDGGDCTGAGWSISSGLAHQLVYPALVTLERYGFVGHRLDGRRKLWSATRS